MFLYVTADHRYPHVLSHSFPPRRSSDRFLGVVAPGHALDPAHHRQLLANCFAQGAALMKGRTFEEALAKADGDPALARAKTFPGNRPSSTILLDRLDPATLGALIAFYENRTLANAVLMGINPFDKRTADPRVGKVCQNL